MTTTDTPRAIDHTGLIGAGGGFLPVTTWPEMEAVRERHERAHAEYREARRLEALTKDRHKAERREAEAAAAARVLDDEPAADALAAEDGRRREVEAISVRIRAARRAVDMAVREAVQVIRDHDEWREEVAAQRAAAIAERDDLRAQAAAADARAHVHGHFERWLSQAATPNALGPRPFRAAGPPPPGPQTVEQVFGGAA